VDTPELLDPTLLAVPGFVGLLLLELAVVRLSGRDDYEAKDTTASLLMGVGNLATDAALGGISVALLLAVWAATPLDLGWGWPVFVLCFLADDFRFYWSHRLHHVSRWFWGVHIAHHSSQHYNLSTALRQPWLDHLSGAVLLRVPLVLLGFHPAIIAFCYALNLIYQFWIHTEHIKKLPAPIELVFNTPSHHRVHHASNPRYLDANFAGTLIVWDRLFGTFIPELADEPPRYGLLKNIGTFNPVRIALHEWIAIAKDATRPRLSLPQRLGYIFGPPGWSHDQSRLTTVQLKAHLVAEDPSLAGTPGYPQAAPAALPAPAQG